MVYTVGIYTEMYRGGKDGLPSLRDPQPVQPLTDRAQVLDYMRSATPVFDVLETVPDLFDPSTTIPGGPSLVSDGVWLWRTDSVHYLSHYSLALPEEFLRHVRAADYRPPTALTTTDEFDAEVLKYF